MKKVILGIAIIFVVLLGMGVILYLNGAMPIGSGYSSKYVCSQVFLADRDSQQVFEQDVKPTNILFKLIQNKVNHNKKTVTSAGFGFWHPTTAIYREGFGCTLAIDVTREELLQEAQGALPQTKHALEQPWPAGEQVDFSSIPAEVDREQLNKVVADAFVEPDPGKTRNTQAVVIVYQDSIIAEQYNEQFGPATPMLGWSMSKSVTSALVGILVKDGKLKIEDPAPVAAWQKPGDPRSRITLDQLLRMSSGLEFEEEYQPFTDVVNMLYGSKSMADFAQAKPLAGEPDSVWNYSSGSANIVARIVKDQVGGTLVSFNDFARTRLFDRIQMRSAIIEPDASGSFVGSSYMFATARDWARIGLLYLNDGVWGGDSILPAGWVTYSTTPTPKAPMGEYGAQIWLNAGEKGNPTNRKYPSLPMDMYYFSGFNRQIVAVIPSRDVIVVRLGVTHDEKNWDVEAFIREVLACIKQPV
jgi:CubicO group peptidase (beta-lactamase class C family)